MVMSTCLNLIITLSEDTILFFLLIFVPSCNCYQCWIQQRGMNECAWICLGRKDKEKLRFWKSTLCASKYNNWRKCDGETKMGVMRCILSLCHPIAIQCNILYFTLQACSHPPNKNISLLLVHNIISVTNTFSCLYTLLCCVCDVSLMQCVFIYYTRYSQ